MRSRAALVFLIACHSPPRGEPSPAGSAVMLPAPLHPGAIAERSPPSPGAEVIVCFQQTRASQATGIDCRVKVTASPRGVHAAHIHQAARAYLGGSDYLALYVQPDAPAAHARGAKVADDATDLSRHVGRDEAGRYYLFMELSRP